MTTRSGDRSPPIGAGHQFMVIDVRDGADFWQELLVDRLLEHPAILAERHRLDINSRRREAAARGRSDRSFFRRSRAVDRQWPRIHGRSPSVKDHVQAGQRDGADRDSGGDQRPPVSDAHGNTGQAQTTEHRQDVDLPRIVTTWVGAHRHRVWHAMPERVLAENDLAAQTVNHGATDVLVVRGEPCTGETRHMATMGQWFLRRWRPVTRAEDEDARATMGAGVDLRPVRHELFGRHPSVWQSDPGLLATDRADTPPQLRRAAARRSEPARDQGPRSNRTAAPLLEGALSLEAI